MRVYMLRESGKCTLLHFARTELELDVKHGVRHGVERVLTAGDLAPGTCCERSTEVPKSDGQGAEPRS